MANIATRRSAQPSHGPVDLVKQASRFPGVVGGEVALIPFIDRTDARGAAAMVGKDWSW